jgi:hypothetical protein
VFLDYPLGHTAGRVGETDLNRVIVSAAIGMLTEPASGTIVDLPYHWGSTDAWKDSVMQVTVDPSGAASTNDDRIKRWDTPQYQHEADAAAAADSHHGQNCVVCEGIDY